MKNHDIKEEVSKILQEATPARQALVDNYNNLLNVADYCYQNYLQSGSTSQKALEETKNLTSQSLASVAYQISTMASSVLRLLDAQTNQLRQMESSINLLGQTVDMHREKVARREIGVLATAKKVPRSHRLIAPAAAGHAKRPYARSPISYCLLDSVGHAVKVSGNQLERSSTVRRQGSSVRSTKPPVQCPVVPQQSEHSTGSSFGKPVAPPTVPSWPGSPDSDLISTVLEAPPPPPEQASDVMDAAAYAPPPPAPPGASPGMCAPPPPAPPPPPLATSLETVLEEGFAPPPDEDIPPPPNQDLDMLAPPPPPAPAMTEARPDSRSRRAARSPAASRSLSLRVHSGPASRVRSSGQSLSIPPPPPYPPPHAPCPPVAPRPCLPARLQHLDLEISALPPPPLLDDEGGFEDIMPPLPPPVDFDCPPPPPEYLDKMVALYSYEASKPGDLSFTQGDVIYLICRQDNGWSEGVVNGIQGFFPENYVQSAS